MVCVCVGGGIRAREGKGGLTHTGRKYRKCPIGKTSSNVIVNFELIYCLGGHEREALLHPGARVGFTSECTVIHVCGEKKSRKDIAKAS